MDFIEQIKLILNSWIAYKPKSESQALYEYHRRHHLFILCQSSIKHRLGYQPKPITSLFHRQNCLSILNTMSAAEINEFYDEREQTRKSLLIQQQQMIL